MILVMIPSNLFFAPKFGVPYEVVKASLAVTVIPFNLFKSILNSFLTLQLFMPLG